MDYIHRKIVVAVLIAIIAAWLPPGAEAAAGGNMEGRWQLREQTYGRGNANLADFANPLMIEFTSGIDGWLASVWVGEEAESVFPWPSFVADRGPLPVRVLERRTGPGASSAMVRYLVRPSEEDALVLDIIEEYSVGVSGENLDGTMTVTFTVNGETRGSYVLHRHFVKVSP